MNRNRKASHKQNGMVLVISLIILMTLTLLALASMQATSTQVGMAGNLRESSVSFNAAEFGLVNAENFVESSAATAEFDDLDKGLYGIDDADPDYLADSTWDDSHSVTVTLAKVYQQPQFIIKYLGDRTQNSAASINIGSYGQGAVAKTVSHFRITARGVGQTGTSSRYIQSYYGKEY
jgi:type IV pilus assembly protein PilX